MSVHRGVEGPPLDVQPELHLGTRHEEFRRLQDAALAELGVATTSSFVSIDTPPLRVHQLEAGVGAPVLMIHGGNSVAASWGPLIGLLAPRFHLLMPDRPGCGLTTPPFDYRGVDLRTHGSDFLGALLDALGQRRVAIVGNSMGGYFAMSFALAHPDRVSRLVLLGEPAGSSGDVGSHVYHRATGTRGLNTLLYATALRPPRDAAGARKGLTRSHLVAEPSRISETLLACFAAAARLPGATRAWRTMVERAFVPPGRGLFTREMVLTHALLPELERLTTPTLILWGDKDPLGTPDDGRTLVERMPNARLEVIEDASHLVWLDQPEVCAEAVTDFLCEDAMPVPASGADGPR